MEQSLKDAQKTSESCDNCSDLKIEKKSVADFVDAKPLQSHPVEEVPKMEESSCDIRQDIVVGFDRQSEVLSETTLGCDTKTSEDDIGEVSASDERRSQSIRLDDVDCGSKKESIIASPLIEASSDAELPIVSTEEVKLSFDDAEKMGRKEDAKAPPTSDAQGTTLGAEAAIFHSSNDHKEPGDIVTNKESKGEIGPEIQIQLESRRISDLREPPICSAGMDGFVPGKLGDTVPSDRMDDKVSGFEKKIELKELAATEEDVTEKTSKIFAHDIEARESPESLICGEVSEESKCLHGSEARDLKVQSDQYIDPKNTFEIKISHADAIETAISKDDDRKTVEKDLGSKEIGSNGLQDVFAAKEVSVSDVQVSIDSSAGKSDKASSNFAEGGFSAREVSPDDKISVKEDKQISKEANNLSGVVNEGKSQEEDTNIISKSPTHFDAAKETTSPNKDAAADAEVSKKISDDTIQYDAHVSESEAGAVKSTALSLNGILGKEVHDESPTAMKYSERSAVKGSGEILDDRKENLVRDSKIDERRDVKVSETKSKDKEFTDAAASNIISEVCKDDNAHAMETLDEKRIELDVGKEEKAITEGGEKEHLPSLDTKIGLQSDENLSIKEPFEKTKELPPKELPHEEAVAKLTEAPQNIPIEKSSPNPVEASTHVELLQNTNDDDNKSDTDTMKPAKEAGKIEVPNGEPYQDIPTEGGDKENLSSLDTKIGLQNGDNLSIKEPVEKTKELPPKELPHEEAVAKLTETPQNILTEKSSPNPVEASTHVEFLQNTNDDDDNKSDTDTMKPPKEAEKIEVPNGEPHQDIPKEMPPKDLVQSSKVSEDVKSDATKPEREVKKGIEPEVVQENEICQDVAQELPRSNAVPCLDTAEDLKINTPEPLRDLELHVENSEQSTHSSEKQPIESGDSISKEISEKLEQITKTSEDLKDGVPELKSEIDILDAGQSMSPAHESIKQHETYTDDDGTLKSYTDDQKEIMKSPSDVNSGVSDTMKDDESDILISGQSNPLEESIKHEDAHTDVPHEISVKAGMTEIVVNINESKPEVCNGVEHKEHDEPTKPVDNREIKQEVPMQCPDHPASLVNAVLDVGDTKGESESDHIPTGSKEVICDIPDGNVKDDIQTSKRQISHEDDQLSQLQTDKEVIEEVPKDLHEDGKAVETFDSEPVKLEESLQDEASKGIIQDEASKDITQDEEASKDIIQDAPIESGSEVVPEDSVDRESRLTEMSDEPNQLEESIQVAIISEDQVVKSIEVDLIASGEEETKKDDHVDHTEDAGKEGKEGDHDSGVDESTQGKLETADESHDTPTKALSGRRDADGPLEADKGKSSIPTTPRSKDVRETSDSSAAAKSPLKTSSKTPPSATMPAKIPPVADKKVPMNKVVVGTAPSPNLKVVKSKIGSMQNVKHRPGGGQVKVETKKIDLTSVKPKVGSTDHATYKPGGGDKKVVTTKLEWKAQSKIGSLDNAQHKPGGGEKKIESVKLNFKDKAKPRVGSTDNIKHKPGGGQVQIEEHKLEIKAKAKIGSLENAQHKPGGGNVQIFDEKTYYNRQESSSKTNSEGHMSGEQSPDAELSSLQPGGQEANGDSAQ